MTSALDRPLSGLRVGLSIGNSDDSPLSGDNDDQVNGFSFEVAQAMCGQGIRVVFGHAWFNNSVMETVHSFAQRYGSTFVDADGPGPLLENLVPWGQEMQLHPKEIENIKLSLSVQKSPAPPDIVSSLEDLSVSEHSYVMSRSLTYARRQLINRTDARICGGGKRFGYAGRLPGIVEEALFALEAGQPVYLIGLLGGAAGQVIQAVCGETMPDGFADRPKEVANPELSMRSLYRNPPVELSPNFDEFLQREDVGWLEPAGVWDRLAKFDLARFSELNGLTEDDNQRLFRTVSVGEVIRLVLKGMHQSLR